MAERREAQRSWQFAEGRVGYAIGDIHGRADLLELLLSDIEGDIARTGAQRPVLIFLGDYVDRGPHAKAVIDAVLTPRAGVERRLLRGNHEAAMSFFLDKPWAGRAWLGHGGAHTMLAYGLAPPLAGASRAGIERAAARLKEAMGPAHLRFLADLERFAIYGDYFFVHAGIDPRAPLHAQRDADFYWIRDRFLKSNAVFSHCVVHGHTPVQKPYRDTRRLAVDTGAYFSGRLSAARLEGADVRFLTAEHRQGDELWPGPVQRGEEYAEQAD